MLQDDTDILTLFAHIQIAKAVSAKPWVLSAYVKIAGSITGC